MSSKKKEGEGDKCLEEEVELRELFVYKMGKTTWFYDHGDDTISGETDDVGEQREMLER